MKTEQVLLGGAVAFAIVAMFMAAWLLPIQRVGDAVGTLTPSPTNVAEQGAPATPLGVNIVGMALLVIATVAAFFVLHKDSAEPNEKLKREELFETLEDLQKRRKLEGELK